MDTNDIKLSPNIKDPDDFYANLIAYQKDLNDDDAIAFYARVIFILANHIGDQTLIMEALKLASDDLAKHR